MSNEIMISIMKFDQMALIYFAANEIPNADMVENAYLLLKMGRNKNTVEEVNCYLNENVDLKYLNRLNTGFRDQYRNFYEDNVLIDITENFHLIASGMIKNEGLIVEFGGNNLYSCQLQLTYKKDIIAPNCRCMRFFDKELIISSYQDMVVSPCFLSANSSVITFSIQNLGHHAINVYIQNSPDAKVFVNDAQTIVLNPNETGLLIPYKFTKYTRIVATSAQNGIVAKLWYQTQLIR